MKIALLYPTLLAMLLIAACHSSRKATVVLENASYKLPLPPNTVQIDNNLFADVTEIANIDYREYLNWLKTVFGAASPEYFAALPDTLVWVTDTLSYSGEFEFYSSIYHQHPAFMDYPAVGLNYEQANAYAAWRSDRVFEMILAKSGKLAPLAPCDKNDPACVSTYLQNASNYFTIQRYFDGKIPGLTKPDQRQPYPVYRLPSKAEWEKIAAGRSGADPLWGLDLGKKSVVKSRRNGESLFNTRENWAKNYPNSHKMGGGTAISAPVTAYYPNDYGLYNTIGNVSEMVQEKGISKGGSWTHPADACAIRNDIPYEKATYWLGFRNVCSWKLW